MREHGTLHIPDVRAQNDFPMVGFAGNSRTYLIVPLRQQGELIGTLIARRIEVRPSPRRRSSSSKPSPTRRSSPSRTSGCSKSSGIVGTANGDERDSPRYRQLAHGYPAGLDAVAENAARVCGANDAIIFRLDGDVLGLVASYGTMPFYSNSIPSATEEYPSPGVVGRAVVDRQLPCMFMTSAAELESEFPEATPHTNRKSAGGRSLATPLLREEIPIGAIHIRRMEVRPFTDKQIKLLETFADQAVIAIENVRLFKELQDRNRQLTEALEQQTATSEILRVISSSPTDLQPVFQTILDNAVRLCEAQNGALFRFDGETLRGVALYNVSPAMEAYALGTPFRPGRESAVRRVALERRLVHVPDVLAHPN